MGFILFFANKLNLSYKIPIPCSNDILIQLNPSFSYQASIPSYFNLNQTFKSKQYDSVDNS